MCLTKPDYGHKRPQEYGIGVSKSLIHCVALQILFLSSLNEVKQKILEYFQEALHVPQLASVLYGLFTLNNIVFALSV